MKALFKIFRGTFTSWDDLFDEAAAFGTTLGHRRVISVGHSEASSKGVVTLWYGEGDCRQALDEAETLGYQYFRGSWPSWENLFAQAAAFSASVGPEHVLSISHSSEGADGVVVVWYWS